MHTNKLEVLIVDDCPIARKVIESTITRILPVNLYFAFDGQEAVDICLQKKFHLIIMDYNMPNKKGDEATKDIRAGILNPEGKCIILTCSATKENETGYSGIFPGADDRLEKPVKLGNLKEILKKVELYKEIKPSCDTDKDRSSVYFFDTKPVPKQEKEEKNCCKKFCTIL